jgi:hypothetical protein
MREAKKQKLLQQFVEERTELVNKIQLRYDFLPYVVANVI